MVEAASDTSGTRRGTVLLVDPDSKRQKVAADTLKPDFELLPAHTADQALRVLSAQHVDILVAVHPLPESSGLGLLRQARARWPGVVRVVASEERDSAMLVEAVNEARVSYLLKLPWDPAVFRELIDGLSGLIGVRKQLALGGLTTSTSGSSNKSAFTGVLSLPVFYRRLQRELTELPKHPGGTLLCAEIDLVAGMAVDEAAMLAQLRLLAASSMEAAAAFPNSHTARTGNRILAFAPGCAAADAATLGEEVVAAFARSTALTVPATASIGFASFPRHGGSALKLMELADEALQRAQRMGGGQLAQCLPRLLMLGPLSIFQKMVSSLTRRHDLVLTVKEQSEGLGQLVGAELPAAIVANLLGPRTALDDLVELLKKPEFGHTRVIFATPKELRPDYTARAARVPGSILVCGAERFAPRVMEAVVRALGLAERLELTLQQPIIAQLLLPSPLPAQSAVLSNISDAAALVTLQRHLNKGEPVTLRIEGGGERVDLGATVARCSRLGIGEFDCALTLKPLGAQLVAKALQVLATAPRLVQKAPEASFEQQRTSERYVPDRFGHIKVRVRPTGKQATSYFRVANLSFGGLLCIAAPAVHPLVRAGDWAETMVYDPSGSLHCVSQVMHEQQRPDGRWQVGLRFTNLDRDAHGELERMLARCRLATGWRGE